MWEVLAPEVSVQFTSENHMEGILAVFLYAKMHFPLLLDTLLIYISQPLSQFPGYPGLHFSDIFRTLPYILNDVRDLGFTA